MGRGESGAGSPAHHRTGADKGRVTAGVDREIVAAREMAFVPVFSESAVDPLASVNVPLMLLMLTEAMNAVLSPPLGSTPASVMVWLPAGTQKFSVQDR